MIRSLVALATIAVASLAVNAGDAGKVTISWHGQSFFLIKSTKGTIPTTLAIDPHDIPEYGRVEKLRADCVLFSHLHNDHTQKEVFINYKDKNFKVIPGLVGKGKDIKWNEVKEQFKEFRIRSVGAYHDDVEGMKNGLNTIFIIEVDGWRIVHLGDLGHTLTEEQIKKIGEVDVLLIPVGGVYTLNGSEAKKVQAQLKPREYIIPMHYGNIRYDDLLTVDEFLDGNPATVALSKDGGLIINKDKSMNARFVRKSIITTDNTIVLDRDPNRPRPLLTVLHWWPQPRIGKKKTEK
ncbi:MAG TPA: MBL fold metallo-hydrolase [Gemmataceae bacterium]|nr:MBL fold metallo-hydrolase [Gemmataceae bacterium]